MELRVHQNEAVDFISRKKRCILGDEMGLGKTLSSLSAVKHNNWFPCLIICPKIVEVMWNRKAKKVFEDKEYTIYPYTLLKKNYAKLCDEVSKYKSVIFDESHFLKNRKSIRSKISRTICRRIANVIMLSGTQVVNRPHELLHPIDCLGYLKHFGGPVNFMRRYCRLPPGKFSFKGRPYDVTGASNTEQLYKQISSLFYLRRNKEDILNLPEKTRQLVDIEIDLKKYNEYLEEWYLSVRNESKKLSNFSLRNIHDIRRLLIELKKPILIDWMKNFQEQVSTPLIVVGYYPQYLKELSEEFKGSRLIIGETKDRQQVIDDFKEGKVPILFLNYQCAGVGLNLTESSHMMFYELPWSPGELLQTEDRIHRIKQKNSCFYYYILVMNTVEQVLYNYLLEKMKVTNTINRGGEKEESDLDFIDHFINFIEQEKESHD